MTASNDTSTECEAETMLNEFLLASEPAPSHSDNVTSEIVAPSFKQGVTSRAGFTQQKIEASHP